MSVKVSKNEVNMISGPIIKGLLKIAIPIMIMQVFQSIFSFIDMTMLGKYVGDKAVGAVGACSTLITAITCLVTGVAVGANVVVARHIAKGDQERKEKAIGTSIFIAALGGLFLMIIGVVFGRTFLTWMNVSPSLMDGAVTYFTLYFIGCPISLLYSYCANILRAAGDSRRPMYFLLVGGVLKITVNYLLLRFTNFTVQGVAIATIVCWSVSGGSCFYLLLRGKGSVKFKWSRFRIYPEELKSLLHIGIPTGIYTMAYSFANVIIASTVNTFGEHATEGIAIANTFDGLIYQIAHSPSLAVLPFISQNCSIKNYKRVKETLLKGSFVAAMICFVAGSLSAIFSGQLASLMSQTPEVIAFAKQKMIIVSSTYFICAVQDVVASAMRGIGKPIIPTIATLVFTCAFRFFWVYLVFPLYPNLTFLYLVWPLGWILNIITLGIAFFYFLIKMQKKANEEKLLAEGNLTKEVI